MREVTPSSMTKKKATGSSTLVHQTPSSHTSKQIQHHLMVLTLLPTSREILINRSLDDKLYRIRYVVPSDSLNAKPPTPGYVIQDSSSTGARDNDDFGLDKITFEDYEYNRNPRYIKDCE